MAWIDNKHDYDMFHQSWIKHYLKIYKIPDQVIQFNKITMEKS